MSFAISWDIIARDKFTAVSKKVEKATAEINNKFKQISEVSKKLEKDFEKVGKSFNKMAEVGKSIEYKVGLPVKAAFLVAINSAKNFQDAIIQTQIYTGHSYDLIESSTKALADKMKVSYQDAATAFGYWSTATEDMEINTKAMTNALNYAKVSGEDIGTVSDRAYRIMSNLNIEVKDSAKVFDTQALFMQYGLKGTGEYVAAIERIGPAARAIGVDLEGLFGIFGTLEKAGVTSNRSIMGVTQVMHSLSNVSDDTRKAFKAVNVDLEGKNFIEVMNEIEKKVLSRSDIDFDKFFAATFGEGTRLIIQDLIKNMGTLNEYTNDFKNNAEGAAEAGARIKSEALSSALTKLGNSFTKLYNSIITKGVLEKLAKLIMMLVGWIDALSESIGPVARRVILLGGALLVVLGPIIFVIAKIGLLIGMLYKFGGIIMAVALKLPLIGAALKWVAMIFTTLLRLNPVGLFVTVAMAVGYLLDKLGILRPALEFIGNIIIGIWDKAVGMVKYIYEKMSGIASFFGMATDVKNIPDGEINYKTHSMTNIYEDVRRTNINRSESDINININAPSGVVQSVQSKGDDDNVHLSLSQNILAGSRLAKYGVI